jgi:hypothetical protein
MTILLIIAFLVLIIVSPVVTIWSLNTLFGLAIDYTLQTWLATVWLSMVTFGNVATAIRNKKDN